VAVLSLVALLLSGCAERGTMPSRRDHTRDASITRGPVLLADTFDEPRVRWLPASAREPTAHIGYVAGEYQVRLEPEFPTLTDYASGPSVRFANVRVAVDVRLVGGVEGRWVGVNCRMVRTGDGLVSGYALQVMPAIGLFAVGRSDAGSMVLLAGPQASMAIRRGHASNRLELTCAGPSVIARINGGEVASVQDRRYGDGFVTLLAGRAGSMAVDARFDNLVIEEVLGHP
jgi:hypothetical protein